MFDIELCIKNEFCPKLKEIGHFLACNPHDTEQEMQLYRQILPVLDDIFFKNIKFLNIKRRC